ncbi:MAG: NAD+ synthase [bacterium]|nr:NAD+ synthase [bacterium]
MKFLRVGLAQINVTVGALQENTEKIISYIHQASNLGVDLLAFPELAVTGYPPEDLLFKPQFIEDNLKCLNQVAKFATCSTVVIVGFVNRENSEIYNAAAVIADNNLAGVYHKMQLPNYGVFDEKRYFTPGTENRLFVINGIKVGVGICEDIWHEDGPWLSQAESGAELIVNINASPYHHGKWKDREKMLSTRAADGKVFIAYNNLIGGQDELVFDGQGLVFNPDGKLLARGKAFAEELLIADIVLEQKSEVRSQKSDIKSEIETVIVSTSFLKKWERKPIKQKITALLKPVEEVYQALVCGTRDYVSKNGFKRVVIGLSGGIDSSLVAVIAVDALGKQNVTGVFMPSKYSSKQSLVDAQKLAANLGIRFIQLPIHKPFSAFLEVLADQFKGRKPDVTEENLQARIRGNLMMALSNKFGCLVLTTGNKSEMSTGYATLYGDMAGGFAVIKDVPKLLVYTLSRYRNRLAKKMLIPKSVLTKAPTAELKPNQKDADTLPPYDILDPIVHAYVEENKSYAEIVALGYNKDTVHRVIRMVDTSEYKRRQAPPGIKITERAFGRDRRFPITNRYRETR